MAGLTVIKAQTGITPEKFVPRMVSYWEDTLGNVSSPPLEEAWGQLAETFNRQLRNAKEQEDENITFLLEEHMFKWAVLPMPTGAGKTQGLALYCAMMAEKRPHPGILIITEFIESADKLRDTINKIAGYKVAISRHSKSYRDDEIAANEERLVAEPEEPSTLIITHAAFKNILKAEARNRKCASNWSRYFEWQGDVRKLIVIDEVLNVVEHISFTIEDVLFVQSIMPVEVTKNFPKLIAVIDAAITHLITIRQNYDGKEKMIYGSEWGIKEKFNFYGLLHSLYEQVAAEAHYKIDEDEDGDDSIPFSNDGFNFNEYQRCQRILNGLQHVLYNWAHCAKILDVFRFSSAYVVLPENMNRAVVLDATAMPNRLYDMLGNLPEYRKLPDNIRNYKNVSLHVFWKKGLGKIALSKKPPAYFNAVLKELSPYIGKDNKVLFCSGKGVKNHFQKAAEDKYKEVGTMHWGAIAGKNHWNDYDSLVIYGVMMLPLQLPKNALRALLEWHDKTGNKYEQSIDYIDDRIYTGDNCAPQMQGYDVYLDEEDYRHNEYIIGQITTDLIQAINRIRCRRVIDSQGNCETSNIYLFLNKQNTYRKILDGVIKLMPGINIIEHGAEKAEAKSRDEDKLIEYLKKLKKGQHDAGKIQAKLEISDTTMRRMVKQMKDENSSLRGDLDKLNITYDAKPGKNGYKTFFIGKSGGN